MEQWEQCHNRSHVLPRQLIQLKPSNNRLMKKQMDELEYHEECKFGRDDDEL